MYGVVLLLAVTAGGESADLGRKGGRGCHGCSGCCGYVSCYGCHGCSGCYGCHGCYGGYTCHGCCGCYGHVVSCHGCCGCYGHVHVPVYSCCGYAPAGGGHAGHGKRAAAESSNAATVVVTLPADAKLTIDGNATTSTSSTRTFETPALDAGKTYSYTLEATYQKDGKAVVVNKKITIEAGKTTNVDLNQAPATGDARNEE